MERYRQRAQLRRLRDSGRETGMPTATVKSSENLQLSKTELLVSPGASEVMQAHNGPNGDKNAPSLTNFGSVADIAGNDNSSRSEMIASLPFCQTNQHFQEVDAVNDIVSSADSPLHLRNPGRYSLASLSCLPDIALCTSPIADPPDAQGFSIENLGVGSHYANPHTISDPFNLHPNIESSPVDSANHRAQQPIMSRFIDYDISFPSTGSGHFDSSSLGLGPEEHRQISVSETTPMADTEHMPLNVPSEILPMSRPPRIDDSYGWGESWENTLLPENQYGLPQFISPIPDDLAGEYGIENVPMATMSQGAWPIFPERVVDTMPLARTGNTLPITEQTPITQNLDQQVFPCSNDIATTSGAICANLHSSPLGDLEEDLTQRNKRPLSTSSSVISGTSRSRQKVLPSSNIGDCATELALDVRRSNSKSKRVSFMPSLRSISSSCRDDIISILGRFSVSSKGTNRSSTLTSIFEFVDESGPLLEHQEEAHELPKATLEQTYTFETPVHLPNQYIPALKVATAKTCTERWEEHECSLKTCPGAVDFGSAYMIGEADVGADKVLPSKTPVGCDRFNHTPLHIASACGAGYQVLASLMDKGSQLHAVNTAGQNFMHVLDPTALAMSGTLPLFLRKLLFSGFDFSKQDHQGSNALQTLLRYPLHHDIIKEIFELLYSHLPRLASRDNLGRCIRSRLAYLSKYTSASDPERAEITSRILFDFYQIRPSSEESLFNFKAAAESGSQKSVLEDVMNQATKDPHFEDLHGRNGLHCWAQHVSGSSGHAPIKGKKKARQPESDSSDQWQSSGINMPYLGRLLHAGVDVTSYDKSGKTPLLALLYYHSYSKKDNDAVIQERLNVLIAAGASVHSRTRDGETALHIAVKRGIITATRVLLTKGANVNARQKDGKGILQLGIEVADEMRRYKNLHIRIMTCINLVKEAGADDYPDVFKEWDAINQRPFLS